MYDLPMPPSACSRIGGNEILALGVFEKTVIDRKRDEPVKPGGIQVTERGPGAEHGCRATVVNASQLPHCSFCVFSHGVAPGLPGHIWEALLCVFEGMRPGARPRHSVSRCLG